MSEPVFRDPLFDGASDPVLVRDRLSGRWSMFYTQRRATVDEPGVSWVHGSRIGVAESDDDGLTWSYRGVVAGLDPPDDPGPNTHWAPEVIDDGQRYHMLLTWIQGVPDRWVGHPRSIVHLVSDDLRNWSRLGPIDLDSDGVIDAAVARVADGRVGLWFKDERADSTTAVAFSNDLRHWSAPTPVVGAPAHEGPNVFRLGGWFWMIVDEWRGQRVLRSADGLRWDEAGRILHEPGSHPLDRQVGRHADVVAGEHEAVVFYFTHPEWDGIQLADAAASATRRTAIHRARLTVEGDRLRCDRDAPITPLPEPPPL